MLRAFLQGGARLGNLVAQLAQALGVARYTVYQCGDLRQESVETLGQRHMHLGLFVVTGFNRDLRLGREHLVQHVLAFHRIGLAVHGEVEQGDGFHDHVKRMDEHHRPATVVRHHEHWKTLVLQRMKHHVMHGNRRGGHQDRQPVTIKQRRRRPVWHATEAFIVFVD
jgi:hypothetical protein